MALYIVVLHPPEGWQPSGGYLKIGSYFASSRRLTAFGKLSLSLTNPGQLIAGQQIENAAAAISIC